MVQIQYARELRQCDSIDATRLYSAVTDGVAALQNKQAVIRIRGTMDQSNGQLFVFPSGLVSVVSAEYFRSFPLNMGSGGKYDVHVQVRYFPREENPALKEGLELVMARLQFKEVPVSKQDNEHPYI